LSKYGLTIRTVIDQECEELLVFFMQLGIYKEKGKGRG